MFRPWQGANALLATLTRRISQPEEISGKTRWLLGAAMVIAVAALCYAIYRLWPYMKGFEEYGTIGAFIVSFITSTTVIFPLPGFAIIGVIAANPALNWALVALAATIGGGLGESTAYLAGYGGAAIITHKQRRWYTRAENWMRRHGSATIFIFSLTWLPFDIIGIAAGALRFPFWKFLLATIAGRLPKTFIGCYLAYKGWEILSEREWWSGISLWSWVIVCVSLAVMTVGTIILWRRLKA